MAHKNKYLTILIRADVMEAIEKETIKKSQKNNKLTSKTKLLEQILTKRYDLPSILKENDNKTRSIKQFRQSQRIYQ